MMVGMTDHPNHAVDEVDLAILRLLEEDARVSISVLATRVHVSRANAYARVHRLVETGVIKRFTVHVSPEALDLSTSAFISINITQESWRRVFEALSRVEGVEHVALCSGVTDVVVLVRTKDTSALRDLVLDKICSIPGVGTTRTSIILKESNNPRLHGDSSSGARSGSV